MDEILEDMGSKWDTLTQAQQVSLAQTVAGTRQYTQLVALMDNWSTFQENLATAQGASGSLQEQADTYAESWEAARQSVQTSLQGIYQSLIDDDFFIDLANLLSSLIDGVGGFVKALGGAKPLLISISTMFVGMFSGKVAEGLNTFKNNLLITFRGAKKQADELSAKMNASVAATLSQGSISSGTEGKSVNLNASMRQSLENTQSLTVAKNRLMMASKDLSASEQQAAEVELNLIQMHQQEAQAIADTITQIRARIEAEMTGDVYSQSDEGQNMANKYLMDANLAPAYESMVNWIGAADVAYSQYLETLQQGASAGQEQVQLTTEFQNMSVAAGELANNFKGLRESSPKFSVYSSQAQDYMKTLQPLASVSEY